MDVASALICFLSLLRAYSAIPPEICFQQFKWEDCGAPPKAVIYYYKSGSRCEVGMWRGCMPNPNMFADEYECVETCIFSLRAKPQDFHENRDNDLSVETTPGPIETTTLLLNDTTMGTDGTEGATAVGGSDTDDKTGDDDKEEETETEATEAPSEAEERKRL